MTTSKPLTVRPAVLSDVATIVSMNAAIAAETEDVALDLARLERGVSHALANPHCARYFIAERAGQTVGQLMVTTEWSDWRCGEFWWIQSVYVTKQHRRTGVYRDLYDHLLTAAQSPTNDPPACGIRLYVERDNATARATYSALGMLESHYRLYEVDFVVKRSP